MRALAMVWLVGCSYSTPTASGLLPGDAPPGNDTGIDESPPIDTSTTCLTAATATSAAGHHYFVTTDGTFAASKTVCETNGGHLVKIEDGTEDDFLTATFNLGGSRFEWIGLSDPMDADVYVWTDGTPLLVNYNGFSNGIVQTDPDNNCVDSNGQWDLFGCGATNHGGICECE